MRLKLLLENIMYRWRERRTPIGEFDELVPRLRQLWKRGAAGSVDGNSAEG